MLIPLACVSRTGTGGCSRLLPIDFCRTVCLRAFCCLHVSVKPEHTAACHHFLKDLHMFQCWICHLHFPYWHPIPPSLPSPPREVRGHGQSWYLMIYRGLNLQGLSQGWSLPFLNSACCLFSLTSRIILRSWKRDEEPDLKDLKEELCLFRFNS